MCTIEEDITKIENYKELCDADEARSSKSFDKGQYDLVDGVLWQIITYCLQDILQLVDGIWLGLKCLVAFKHSSPDMVMKRIKVR